MPKPPRSARTLAVLSTALIALLALVLHLSTTQANQESGSMAAMSVDMDPGAAPANTATALGSREFCARIDENDILDADEEAVDALQFDVTAEAIPATAPLFGYFYTLAYDEVNLTLMTQNFDFLLNSAEGSSVFNASAPLPDTDENGSWQSSKADLNVDAAESGSGVLDRILLRADTGAAAGVYRLHLSNAAHLDPDNTPHTADVTADAFAAINTDCPTEEPTPEPTPSAPPTPQPHPIVRGTVRDQAGNPLEGASVEFTGLSCQCYYGATTDALGSYEVQVHPGNYQLHAALDGYVAEFWTSTGGTTDPGTAEGLFADFGPDIVGVDFSLNKMPTVSGRVTDANGAPLADVSVSAIGAGCCQTVERATDAEGYYKLPLEAAGTYFLKASKWGYVEEYWTASGGTPAIGNAAIVTAPGYGETLGGYDFTLRAYGRILGSILDSAGNPLEDAHAFLEPVGNPWCECSAGTSDSTGAYEITNIRPGQYRLQVFRWGYTTTYWSADGGTTDPLTAGIITVNPDDVLQGFDLYLSRLGIVRGNVTDAQGDPIEGASVSAYSPCCGYSGYATTDANGDYEIINLQPGEYRVAAWAYRHRATFWASTGSIGDEDNAGLLALSLDQVVVGIDLTMPKLARLSGTATDSQGRFLYAEIIAHPVGGGDNIRLSDFSSEGAYEGYLYPGTYRLSAFEYGFQRVFWTSSGMVYQESDGELITVALEEDRPGFDFTLPRLGSISGRLTDNHGAPIGRVTIQADQATCCSSGSAQTNQDGYFRIENLELGDYFVHLWDWPVVYYWSSSGATPARETADLVSVAPETDTSAIDFVIPRLAELRGTVTDNAGIPLESASVYTVDEAGRFRSTETAADGSYVIANLPPGDFRVSSFADTYEGEFWTESGGTQDQNLSQRIHVELDTITVGINFQLSRLGIITGTVRDNEGNPVVGISVGLHSGWCCYSPDSYTDSDGVYRLERLSPGLYGLGASGTGYETTYWTTAGGTANPILAEQASTAYDSVTMGVDFVVHRLGKISGEVRDSQGSPIVDASVELRLPGDSSCQYCQDDRTDQSGRFAVYGSPGDYSVSAYAYGFVAQYWTSLGGATESTGAEMITLGYESDISPIDFNLLRLGAIQGRLRDNHGSPIDGNVAARGPISRSGYPLAGGFRIDGLYPGDYTLAFYYHGREFYWNSGGGSFDENAAEPVHVDGDETLSDIDFVAPRLGIISGRVTNRSGRGIADALVEAENAWAMSGIDGFYELKYLHAGSYFIHAEHDDYDTVYWTAVGGSQNWEAAEPVTVQYDSMTTGIDLELQLRGELTGTITDSQGRPLSGVSVWAEQQSGWSGSAISQGDGSYRLTNLRAGQHRVLAESPNHLRRYWTSGGGTFVREEAELIAVVSEQPTTDINLAMYRKSTISGRVTDSAGEPIEWVSLGLQGANNYCCYGSGYTDSSGQYQISVSGVGDVIVKADRWPYVSTYWTSTGGLPPQQPAEPISVPPETDITGIDFVLKHPGGISGSVRDNAGNALPYAQVVISGPSCAECRPWVGYDGQYSIDYLYPGEYTIKASHPDYQAEFWADDGGSPEAGDPVTVPEGATVNGIDFSLNKLGSISGTVTGPDGLPVAGASIIYDSAYCEACNGPVSDAQGNFKVDRIPPGEYVLQASAPEMTMDTRERDDLAYSHKRRARTITVGDGQAVEGVSIRLRWSACHYDVTGDATVDARDLIAVVRALGSRPGHHRWNPAADVNDDDRVDGRDLKLVAQAWRSGECGSRGKHHHDHD